MVEEVEQIEEAIAHAIPDISAGLAATLLRALALVDWRMALATIASAIPQTETTASEHRRRSISYGTADDPGDLAVTSVELKAKTTMPRHQHMIRNLLYRRLTPGVLCRSLVWWI